MTILAEGLCHALQSNHVCISVCTLDKGIRDIQDKFEHHPFTVGGLQDLRALLKVMVGCKPGGLKVTLDLIAHAAETERFLKLNDLIVREDNPDLQCLLEDFRDRLFKAGIRVVRILGCGTDTTEKGRETLEWLSLQLNADIFGTIDALWADHYDTDGLNAAGICRLGPRIQGGKAESPTRPFEVDISSAREVEGVDLTGLPAEPRVVTRGAIQLAHEKLAKVADYLEPPWRALPGLQALPDHEILVPSPKERDEFVCMDLLLGGRLLRVYPANGREPAVSKIKDPQSFLEFLHDSPP